MSGLLVTGLVPPAARHAPLGRDPARLLPVERSPYIGQLGTALLVKADHLPLQILELALGAILTVRCSQGGVLGIGSSWRGILSGILSARSVGSVALPLSSGGLAAILPLALSSILLIAAGSALLTLALPAGLLHQGGQLLLQLIQLLLAGGHLALGALHDG